MATTDKDTGWDLSLSQVKSLHGLLERLPHGVAARGVAEALGVWTPALHKRAAEADRPLTPGKWGGMQDNEVSDWNAYWNSEVHRATELLGVLDGYRDMLTIQAKAARAAARGRVRKRYEEAEAQALAEAKDAAEGAKPVKAVKVVKPTAQQINDEADEDPAVIECDQQLALLALIVSSAKAYKEAAIAMTAGLSREISFRQAQLAAKVRY